MTEEEQLTQMRITILGDEYNDDKDLVFKVMLDNAKAIALNTLYPYDLTKNKIDENDKRLKNWQTRCAIELYRKMGTTNVQSYSENGLSVTFMTGLISTSLMNELTPPKAGLPR